VTSDLRKVSRTSNSSPRLEIPIHTRTQSRTRN